MVNSSRYRQDGRVLVLINTNSTNRNKAYNTNNISIYNKPNISQSPNRIKDYRTYSGIGTMQPMAVKPVFARVLMDWTTR